MSEVYIAQLGREILGVAEHEQKCLELAVAELQDRYADGKLELRRLPGAPARWTAFSHNTAAVGLNVTVAAHIVENDTELPTGNDWMTILCGVLVHNGWSNNNQLLLPTEFIENTPTSSMHVCMSRSQEGLTLWWERADD